MRETLYVGSTSFGDYRVIDTMYNGRMSRILYGSNNTPQSGLAMDDDPELLFDYNQRFLEIAQSTQPEAVLIIGGGAMTLPTALSRQLPQTTIDVVEIDPLLPQLAADYFGFGRCERTTVVIDDGVDYIKRCAKQYDMIIVDAFSGDEVATALFSASIASEYQRCLAQDGIVVVNFISKYHTRHRVLTHDLVDNFQSVFDVVIIYPADHDEPRREEQNLILVAAANLTSLDYLQSDVVDVLPPSE
ncbi:MAG: fused MFS/spermidine synthase [Candidatus Saccharimonadales bacterium]